MRAQPRIVLLGAGSMSFGINMLRDLYFTSDLHGCTLALVDTDREALVRMIELAKRFETHTSAKVKIEHSTDRRDLLSGADFVVNATAIDRIRLWKQDFAIPKKHGIRHTLGENGGPGGLFFTLRTLPLIFDIARDIEDLCPNALLINFSNPESRIILALAKYSKVRAVGLCHGLFMSRWAISQILDIPYERLDLWAAGLNHFQCVLTIRDRETGEDLYPRLRAAHRTYDPSRHRLTRRLFEAFGYWLTCSDDHLGEYLPYGWEAGEAGFDFADDARWREDFLQTVKGVLDDGALPAKWCSPSAERAAPVIAALSGHGARPIESIVLWNGGTIPNLPADLAVEVPALLDEMGAHPISLGPLPDAVAGLMTLQTGAQRLAVEAAVHGSKEMALQALLVDPVTNSITAASRLLDELWEINRPYIRACK